MKHDENVVKQDAKDAKDAKISTLSVSLFCPGGDNQQVTRTGPISALADGDTEALADC